MGTAMIKAVIFDMDGCLVDSEPLSLEAVAAEMRSAGLSDATAEKVGEKYLGVSIQGICRDVGEHLEHDSPDAFAARVEDRLFARYPSELRRMPGVQPLLEKLQMSRIGMAIATGSSVRRLDRTLEIAGLAPYFDGRGFSADQVKQGKPAPDLFLLAARQLGVPPEACAVLEDSPHGIAGAAAAGMRAVGFVGGSHLEGRREAHAAVLRSAGAVQVIDSLTQAFETLVPDGHAG
jgi:HAD superfamily hydrolase (TIGR01509 family)